MKNWRYRKNRIEKNTTQNCMTCTTYLQYCSCTFCLFDYIALPSSYVYISLYLRCPLEFLDVFLNIPYARVDDCTILYEKNAYVCVTCMIVLHICVLSIDSTTVYECVYECLFVCNVFACISSRSASSWMHYLCANAREFATSCKIVFF